MLNKEYGGGKLGKVEDDIPTPKVKATKVPNEARISYYDCPLCIDFCWCAVVQTLM